MLKEYIEEAQARRLQQEFKENWASYQEKGEEVTDQQWLAALILKRCRGVGGEQAQEEAAGILAALDSYEKNFQSVEEAARRGVAKEEWLGDKLQESAIGLSAVQYSETLQKLDNCLYRQNQELAEALSRAKDGHIMMSPNLDGNLAEHMLARPVELQGYIQNKNITVDVRAVNTANSVDVRATNQATGEFQNYQMKFGKDAQSTIRLLREGNYNNQRVVVPKEQLEEVQAYFKGIGSKKTITDHIEIDGVRGPSFTKEQMKELQKRVQESNTPPVLDDYYYSTKEYARSVGKNAGAMALQMAAVTTGIDVISKICQGQEIQADEVAETALRAGTDAGVKTVAAGTLHTAVRQGMFSFLPKNLGTNLITGMAFVGVENAKILLKMAEGKLSTVKGLDQMGKVTVSMAGGLGVSGLLAMAASGMIAGPLGVAAGLTAGMVGYAAGSGIGEKVYSGVKKVAGAAKEIGRKAWEGVKTAGKKVLSVAKELPLIGWLF